MIHISFTPTDIQELRHQRFHHPHPHAQRQMEALLLKSFGWPHHQIAEMVGVHPNTVTAYFQKYVEGGVEALKEILFYSPQSELWVWRATLKADFREHPPATIKEAADRIEKLTGIKRSCTQVRKFMHDIGIKRRKVGSIPAKADAAQQKAFLHNKLEPKLNEARQGKRLVFFVDAAHFVFAPFLGYLWSLTRLFVRAPSGRQRFNVLAAIDAVSHALITVTNETYINAQSVCSLLHLIAQTHAGLPITMVLDNAKYQRCAIVQQLALSLRIELLYLPPYSPNLNLIERLWKFVKKQCLRCKYYPDFLSFHTAISGFLETVHIRHQAQLATLLSHRFQDFNQDQTPLVPA